MKCIVWLLDKGAEGMFANSLGSLKLNARRFWDENLKLILDFGLSDQMRSFLDTLRDELVYVRSLTLPKPHDVVGGDPGGGVGVMRTRVEISNILKTVVEALSLSVDDYLICDCDTAFITSPEPLPMPSAGGQISIMKEWDVSDGAEVEMKLCRSSSFVGGVVPWGYIPRISNQLGMSDQEFISVPTYNTGVFGFRAGAEFSNEWKNTYDLIKGIVDDKGLPIFSPFAAEQNAFSLCVFRGSITISELPRRFNQFPPRPPSSWPDGTVIAHFITFKKNQGEARYSLWYEIRDRVLLHGLIPVELVA